MGLTIDCELSDDLPPVMANPFSLEEVVINLIANARDAMIEKRKHSPRVNPAIKLRTSYDGGSDNKYVKITIQDEGVGILEKHLPKIYDPYFSTKVKGTQKGMGLGLATAYSIIDQHNGRITVTSKVGVGTIFTIYIPVRK